MKRLFRIVLLLAISTSSAFADWHVTAGPKFSRIKLYNSASTSGEFVEAGYSFGWLSLDLGYDRLGSVTKDFYGPSSGISDDFGPTDPRISLGSAAINATVTIHSPKWRDFSASIGAGGERRESEVRYISDPSHTQFNLHSYNPIVRVGISYEINSHLAVEIAVSSSGFRGTSVGDLNMYEHYKKTAQLFSIEPSLSYHF